MMRSNLFTQLELQKMASLNQEGVLQLASCRTREALRFFRQALEILKELEEECFSESGTSSAPFVWSSAVVPYLRNDSFFVYDEALIVAPNRDGVQVLTPSHLRFYSAAVAFNMGLCFHLRGSCTLKPKYLQKAVVCYSQALQDITLAASACANSYVGDWNMMQLLALNNQCQVNYQLGNLTDLRTGLDQIRKLSPTVVLLRCQSPVFQRRGVIGEFMINVLVSDCPGARVQAAPAA